MLKIRGFGYVIARLCERIEFLQKFVTAMFRGLATALRLTVLFVVFLRFHASWVGLSVVAAMAILLFRLDRAVVRWVAGAAGLRR